MLTFTKATEVLARGGAASRCILKFSGRHAAAAARILTRRGLAGSNFVVVKVRAKTKQGIAAAFERGPNVAKAIAAMAKRGFATAQQRGPKFAKTASATVCSMAKRAAALGRHVGRGAASGAVIGAPMQELPTISCNPEAYAHGNVQTEIAVGSADAMDRVGSASESGMLRAAGLIADSDCVPAQIATECGRAREKMAQAPAEILVNPSGSATTPLDTATLAHESEPTEDAMVSNSTSHARDDANIDDDDEDADVVMPKDLNPSFQNVVAGPLVVDQVADIDGVQFLQVQQHLEVTGEQHERTTDGEEELDQSWVSDVGSTEQEQCDERDVEAEAGGAKDSDSRIKPGGRTSMSAASSSLKPDEYAEVATNMQVLASQHVPALEGDGEHARSYVEDDDVVAEHDLAEIEANTDASNAECETLAVQDASSCIVGLPSAPAVHDCSDASAGDSDASEATLR